MAKPNYAYEKRQKELAKKQKKAEKQQRKNTPDNAEEESLAQQSGQPSDEN